MFNYVLTKRDCLTKFLSGLKKHCEKEIVLNNKIIGSKTYCEDKHTDIEVDIYFELNNLCVLRTNDENYVPEKYFVKVSSLFDHENILKGSIKVTNFTLEGTDGVGKSSVIENLLNEGIVCFDRNLTVICKYMLFNVSEEQRITEYKKFFENTNDKILFLVNMDEDELISNDNCMMLSTGYLINKLNLNNDMTEEQLTKKIFDYVYENILMFNGQISENIDNKKKRFYGFQSKIAYDFCLDKSIYKSLILKGEYEEFEKVYQKDVEELFNRRLITEKEFNIFKEVYPHHTACFISYTSKYVEDVDIKTYSKNYIFGVL